MSFWQLVFQHPVAAFFLILAVGWAISMVVDSVRGRSEDRRSQ